MPTASENGLLAGKVSGHEVADKLVDYVRRSG